MVNIEQVSPSPAQFKNAFRRPRTRSARGHGDIAVEAEEFGKVVEQKCMKHRAHGKEAYEVLVYLGSCLDK